MSDGSDAFCKLRKHSPPSETVWGWLFSQFVMSQIVSSVGSEQGEVDKILEKRAATKQHVAARDESEV